MIVKVFAAPADYDVKRLYRKDADEWLIGVDRGAFHAVSHGLTLDLAIGDFDSTTEAETEAVRAGSRRFVKHSDRKDETDTRLAMTEARKHDPEKIVIYGGLGRRLDHTVANLSFLDDDRVRICDDVTLTYALSPGRHVVDNPHRYISFFALEPVKGLTLEGFEYPLADYDLNPRDALCVSNKGSGVVAFTKGRVLVVATSADE